MINECRTRYCSIHNSSYHRYNQCSAKKKSPDSNTNTQSAGNDTRKQQYHGGKNKQFKQNSNVGQKQAQSNRSSGKSTPNSAVQNNQASVNFQKASGQTNTT